MNITMFRESLRMSITSVWNTARVLVKPKDITRYSNLNHLQKIPPLPRLRLRRLGCREGLELGGSGLVLPLNPLPADTRRISRLPSSPWWPLRKHRMWAGRRGLVRCCSRARWRREARRWSREPMLESQGGFLEGEPSSFLPPPTKEGMEGSPPLDCGVFGPGQVWAFQS